MPESAAKKPKTVSNIHILVLPMVIIMGLVLAQLSHKKFIDVL